MKTTNKINSWILPSTTDVHLLSSGQTLRRRTQYCVFQHIYLVLAYEVIFWACQPLLSIQTMVNGKDERHWEWGGDDLEGSAAVCGQQRSCKRAAGHQKLWMPRALCRSAHEEASTLADGDRNILHGSLGTRRPDRRRYQPFGFFLINCERMEKFCAKHHYTQNIMNSSYFFVNHCFWPTQITTQFRPY